MGLLRDKGQRGFVVKRVCGQQDVRERGRLCGRPENRGGAKGVVPSEWRTRNFSETSLPHDREANVSGLTPGLLINSSPG